MNQPKILRRYQVGVDLEHYGKMFIIGCVVSSLVAAVVTALIMAAIFHSIYTTTVDDYELQIDGLSSQLSVIEAAHQEVIDDLNERHANEIQELNTTISNLNARVEQLIQADTASFDVLRRYWYVFKDAPDNSGLSTELITYVDETCKEWDVNPHWMWHIWQGESGWTAKIDNKAGSGARGLGQMMPGTAKNLYENVLKKGTYTHDLAYDPFINAELSICHIGRNIAISTMENAIELYSGGGGSKYFNSVVNKGNVHGFTLSGGNAHYPY